MRCFKVLIELIKVFVFSVRSRGQDRLFERVHLGHVDASPERPHEKHTKQGQEPCHPTLELTKKSNATRLTFCCDRPESYQLIACGRADR